MLGRCLIELLLEPDFSRCVGLPFSLQLLPKLRDLRLEGLSLFPRLHQAPGSVVRHSDGRVRLSPELAKFIRKSADLSLELFPLFSSLE